MVYNNNIPQPTDLISSSQPQILGNFNIIDSNVTGTGTGFSRNHVTMLDGTRGGLHFRVDFNAVTTTPSVVVFVGSAYVKTVTNAELFYVNDTQDMQITNSLLLASNSEGMLPGGVQIKGGTCNSNGSGIVNNFTTAFPNNCFSVVVSGTNGGQPTNKISVTAKSTASFTLKSALGEACYYIAIGN